MRKACKNLMRHYKFHTQTESHKSLTERESCLAYEHVVLALAFSPSIR